MNSPRAAILAFLILLPGPALGQQLGTVRISPRLEAGQPLTVEVQNLSKLPLQLSGTTLRFGGGSPATSCAIELPADIAIGPAGTEVVKLAEQETVRTCLQRARGGAPARLVSPFVLSARQMQQPELRASVPAQAHLEEVAVTFGIAIGKQPPTSINTTWHLPVE